MHDAVVVRHFRVARRDMVFLKFIVEAYEGMMTMSTVDQREGIVRISSADWAAADCAALLASLQADITLEEMPDYVAH